MQPYSHPDKLWNPENNPGLERDRCGKRESDRLSCELHPYGERIVSNLFGVEALSIPDWAGECYWYGCAADISARSDSHSSDGLARRIGRPCNVVLARVSCHSILERTSDLLTHVRHAIHVLVLQD
jgi:hypothetical protein